MPQLAGALGMALDFVETIGASLVVDAARMQANLAAHAMPPAELGAAADELLAELAPYLT